MTNISDQMVANYLDSLVNRFFKILPIKESGEPSLNDYMQSLQIELMGCGDVIEYLNDDHMYLSLIATLQYLIENDCEVRIVKREVFKAISICKKLSKKYCGGDAVGYVEKL